MRDWRAVLNTLSGWAVTSLLAAIAAYGMVQGWLEAQPSRVWTTAGFGLLVVVCVLAWNHLAPWSRPVLILAYLFVLIASMAFVYSPRDTESFAMGPFSLAALVNAVILVGMLLAASVLLRMRWIPAPGRVLLGIFACIGAYPYALGIWREIALPDLFLGAGMPLDLPLWAQPSVLSAAVFLPVAVSFLLVQLVRALGRSDRSTLRALLFLLAGLVPLEIAGATLGGLVLPGSGAAPIAVAGTPYQSGRVQLTQRGDLRVAADFSVSLPDGWTVDELERTPADAGRESGVLAVAFVAPQSPSRRAGPDRVIVQLSGLRAGSLAPRDFFATEDGLVRFLMPRHQQASEERVEVEGASALSGMAAADIEPTRSIRLRTYSGRSRFGDELEASVYTAGGLTLALNIALVADSADHAALELAAAPILDSFRLDVSSEGLEVR